MVNHSCEKDQMLKKYYFVCFVVQNSVPENATITSISTRANIRKFAIIRSHLISYSIACSKAYKCTRDRNHMTQVQLQAFQKALE